MKSARPRAPSAPTSQSTIATQDSPRSIKTETGGRGVDVILDMVGGDYIEKNMRSLADDGRLVNIAFTAGSTATIDFMRVMLKRLTHHRLDASYPLERIQRAHRARDRRAAFCHSSLRAKSKCRSTARFPSTDAGEAHARMESSAHIGKIVLTV